MFLKPPGYFMIKYWEKILLENFSINHCGVRAGEDCWFSGTGLFHGSPAVSTLVSHGVSVGHHSVSLTVNHLSSEHQPCVRTGACRNVQESICHYRQPAIALPMQFVAMLF